jgi:hypothetical protein
MFEIKVFTPNLYCQNNCKNLVIRREIFNCKEVYIHQLKRKTLKKTRKLLAGKKQLKPYRGKEFRLFSKQIEKNLTI